MFARQCEALREMCGPFAKAEHRARCQSFEIQLQTHERRMRPSKSQQLHPCRREHRSDRESSSNGVSDHVRDRKRGDDETVLFVVQSGVAENRRSQQGERVAVDVADRRDQHHG